MLTTTMKMPKMVAVIVERMYRTMENDPQYLLMQDGGPVGRTAHVVIARLYGQDEQLDHEWRIDKAEPMLLTPRMNRPSALLTSDPMELPRAHKYVLQSGFTVAGLARLYSVYQLACMHEPTAAPRPCRPPRRATRSSSATSSPRTPRPSSTCTWPASTSRRSCRPHSCPGWPSWTILAINLIVVYVLARDLRKRHR